MNPDLDVYDPTTGEVHSSVPGQADRDIACWFVDSGHNEESFFVRHAYFTGADEPYKKLRRALKAETDEDAWASLYSTVSRALEAPSTGKIAVKVINLMPCASPPPASALAGLRGPQSLS